MGKKSKKFKNKTCVYCGRAEAAQTPDHVFAREFFVTSQRANLPKVPACAHCNGTKSRLEHYLTTLLPCAGWNPDSQTILETKLGSRLEHNLKLQSQVTLGMERIWVRSGGLIVPSGTLPIDFEKVQGLFCFIMKGLLWHHWRTLLATDSFIDAAVLKNNGRDLQSLWDNRFQHLPHRKVQEDLGDGTFEYEGIQLIDSPQTSIWKFYLYGGLTFGPDTLTHDQNPMVAEPGVRNFVRYATAVWGITRRDTGPPRAS